MNEFPENREASGPGPIRKMMQDGERMKDVTRTQKMTFVAPLRAMEIPGFGTRVTIDLPPAPQQSIRKTWG
jgi:hypothetical protein